MKLSIIAFLLVSMVFTFADLSEDPINDETSIQVLLGQLTGEPSINEPNLSIPGASAAIGESIVKTGFSQKPSGGTSRIQSKHFVCTSCHNVSKEMYNLKIVDPQQRLDYAVEHNMPFLQASPFYGIVSRTSFYNGDYYKKYGDLVTDARNDIRNSIQLCATQCAQGRALKDWEIESVLLYFWTLDLKLKDIPLELSDIDLIENALNKMANTEKALELIKSSYMDHSPATFTDPPVPRKGGREGYTGEPSNGAKIYTHACLHCHENKRYSFFELNNDRLSYTYLANHFNKYTEQSAYQVVRYGTDPVPGKKAYMPHFTLEKMSIQQMEDLRAYIFQQAM